MKRVGVLFLVVVAPLISSACAGTHEEKYRTAAVEQGMSLAEADCSLGVAQYKSYLAALRVDPDLNRCIADTSDECKEVRFFLRRTTKLMSQCGDIKAIRKEMGL